MYSLAPLGSRGTDLNLIIWVFAQAIDHRGLIHFTHQNSESPELLPAPPPHPQSTLHECDFRMSAAVCAFMYEFVYLCGCVQTFGTFEQKHPQSVSQNYDELC